MCVCAVADRKRLTPEMVEKMYNANSAGGGIAWREPDETGKVWVRFEKGLNLEQMQQMCAEVPLPFVAHFRIPTVGGAVPELCHPFVVTREDGNELSGRTQDYVLFHNGHWGAWKGTSMDLATKSGVKLPVGKWSDTRAMAWVAAVCGPGVLDFIDEKTIIFGPKDTELTGTGWSRVDEVVVSNASWNYCTTNYNQNWRQRQQEQVTVEAKAAETKTERVAAAAETSKGKAGGASLPTSFRPPQGVAGSEGDQQEQVQEGTTQAATVAEEAGEGDPQGTSSPLIPAECRWACSINPRRYSSQGVQRTLPRLVQGTVSDEDEADKIRTGMLGPAY